MNLNRMAAVLVVLVLGIFVATTGSFAAKGGNGKGGGKPPPPPPTNCADTFPGFLYSVPSTRKSPGGIYLGSSDGCRSEFVAESGGGVIHMTADGSAGVILWTEDPGNTGHDLVQRQDFTVDANGDLILEGDPVALLPLPGEAAPPEDFLFYFSMDIWGDATHDSLYLAILRSHTVDATSSSTDSIREVLIYNLNDMNDVREIFLTAQNAGEWDCPDPSVAPFPQFVPTCYPKVQSVRFNPSGTRLYMGDHLLNLQGERWDASLRIEIDRVDANGDDMALADWTFSSPAIVYAGDGPDVHNVHPRPGINPSERPSPEVIVSGGQFLNSDQCSAVYAPYADGTSEAPYDLWMQCIDYQFFHIGGNGDSWQTPGTLLTTHNVGQKRQKNI